jgi:hypothetical protein
MTILQFAIEGINTTTNVDADVSYLTELQERPHLIDPEVRWEGPDQKRLLIKIRAEARQFEDLAEWAASVAEELHEIALAVLYDPVGTSVKILK